MSQIRSKNTKPEMLVRKYLFSKGFRYRLHPKDLPGCPDLVLTKYKTVLFVNGCFWHGHTGCKYYKVPKTRTDWWLNKINKNVANDQNALKILKLKGWKVINVWECQLKANKLEKTLAKLPGKIVHCDI